MARVKGKIQYPKKIDFRMEVELYDKLEFIVERLEVKKGSWCRRAVEIRVDAIFNEIDLEEDYERYKEEKYKRTEA